MWRVSSRTVYSVDRMCMNFSEFQKQRQDLEKANAKNDRDLRKKCDWNDPEDRRLYMNDLSAKRIMKALPKGMKCPDCEEVKLSFRQWAQGICKKCFNRTVLSQKEIKRVVFKPVISFAVDKKMLREGGSMKQLSFISGYSQQFLSRADVIKEVQMKDLIDSGVRKEVFTEVVHRYKLNSVALRKALKERGFSYLTFADRCGWTKSYVQYLVNGGSLTVKVETKVIIEKALRKGNK